MIKALQSNAYRHYSLFIIHYSLCNTVALISHLKPVYIDLNIFNDFIVYLFDFTHG